MRPPIDSHRSAFDLSFDQPLLDRAQGVFEPFAVVAGSLRAYDPALRLVLHQKRVIWDETLTEREPLGLYVHIPFCARRCPYCDFAIHVGAESEFVEAYLAALRRELESVLAAAELNRILDQWERSH